MARTMSKQSSSGSLAPWLGVALIVILFDQLSKIAVARVFTYGEPHALTPFFNLFLIYTRGAAFSFLASAGGWQRWGFTALGVVAAIVICCLLK
ncbi:MAG: signal peptidase, partial [Caballeronia sp.]|nr:signal peptidase [Caballeronia sp.]